MNAIKQFYWQHNWQRKSIAMNTNPLPTMMRSARPTYDHSFIKITGCLSIYVCICSLRTCWLSYHYDLWFSFTVKLHIEKERLIKREIPLKKIPHPFIYFSFFKLKVGGSIYPLSKMPLEAFREVALIKLLHIIFFFILGDDKIARAGKILQNYIQILNSSEEYKH